MHIKKFAFVSFFTLFLAVNAQALDKVTLDHCQTTLSDWRLVNAGAQFSKLNLKEWLEKGQIVDSFWIGKQKNPETNETENVVIDLYGDPKLVFENENVARFEDPVQPLGEKNHWKIHPNEFRVIVEVNKITAKDISYEVLVRSYHTSFNPSIGEKAIDRIPDQSSWTVKLSCEDRK